MIVVAGSPGNRAPEPTRWTLSLSTLAHFVVSGAFVWPSLLPFFITITTTASATIRQCEGQ
jgi:hypothetical protein